MALFTNGQECPLCDLPMYDNDNLFATTHFLGPDSDLFAYSDAVMHWDCYAAWEHRARFARLYFDATRRMNERNPHWGIAYVDDQVLIATNPSKLVSKVSIMLAETGVERRVALSNWADWVNGEWANSHPYPIEYDLFSSVMPILRTQLPNAESVIMAAGMQHAAEVKPTMNSLFDRISYEMACQDLAAHAMTKGINCPRCGHFSSDYEYVRIEPIAESGPQSHLVCRDCNNEFGPLDV